MALTRADVVHIADLARLELTDEEIETYQEQLTAVLDYVAMLDDLDLTDVVPTAHAITRQNVFRADVAEPSLSIDDVLFNAPEQQDAQFRIQSVLDA